MLSEDIKKRVAIFQSMAWPKQRQLLEELNVLACGIQGRTYSEAEKKRAHIEELRNSLQRVHDNQVEAWAAGRTRAPA